MTEKTLLDMPDAIMTPAAKDKARELRMTENNKPTRKDVLWTLAWLVAFLLAIFARDLLP